LICNNAGLLDNTNFKIVLTPGSSFSDAFKFSSDPLWQRAWTERIEPHFGTFDTELSNFDKILKDPSVALYENLPTAR
jgi:hypothetical protein